MSGSDSLAAELGALIDDDRERMCALLAALVGVPTENPPARNYEECVSLLESTLSALDIAHRRIDVPSPPDSPRTVLQAWVGDPGPTLYFHGHYDVVPASTAGQFEPRLEGDTLFGRGSSDMKSGLVAMIYAAKALKTCGALRGGRLGLVFVPDEETGGEFGSAALAEMGELARDAIGMLLPEPTSGVVWNANRGAITLEVTVKGRAAHVGLAHQGINAFEQAVTIVNALVALKATLPNSILLIGGRAEAGSNFNVVPEECRFTIDRRLNPDEDFAVERQRLFDVMGAARRDGIDVSIRTLQEGGASASSRESRLGRMLDESIADVTGAPAPFEMCPGLLEIRFYAECGVPAFAYGPGILAVSHGPKEFVRIGRMIECAKVYALTAARMFGSARTLAC
jgi:succinyl-diaminopimelate desuccinylase